LSRGAFPPLCSPSYGPVLHVSFLMLTFIFSQGHVDPGEDDFKAALRETQEEAGFSAEDFVVKDDFKIELNYNANGKSKQVIYWLAVLNDANKMVTLSDEHTDFSWLSIEEACTRSGYSDMQEALRKAHEFINKA